MINKQIEIGACVLKMLTMERAVTVVAGAAFIAISASCIVAGLRSSDYTTTVRMVDAGIVCGTVGIVAVAFG